MRLQILSLTLLVMFGSVAAGENENTLVLNWSHEAGYNNGTTELLELAVAFDDFGFDQRFATVSQLELFIWLTDLEQESDTAVALVFYMLKNTETTVDIAGVAISPPMICSPGDIDPSYIPVEGGGASNCLAYDYNGDLKVDNDDFLVLSARYGQPGYGFTQFLELAAYFGQPCE